MSAIDHFAQGIQFGLAGSYGEAISELTLAAAQLPAAADVLVNLGVALHKAGDDERALASYDAALKLSPKHAEAHYFRANILYARKLIPAGIAGYTMAIGLQPQLIEAHRKALPQDRLTDYADSAVEMYWLFKPAIRILKLDQQLLSDPRQAQAFVDRGSAYFELGNYEQAAADFSSALEIEARSARAVHFRGLARERLGELDQALDDYEQAIKIDPDFSDPYINRGAVLGKQDKLQQAIASLTEGLRLAPADLNGYFNRGTALFRTGDLDAAAADFSRVLELAPQDDGADYWRAQVHEKNGRPQQAVADYESALRLTHDPRVKESAAKRLAAVGALSKSTSGSAKLRVHVHILMQTVLLLGTLPFVAVSISALRSPTFGSIVPILISAGAIWFFWRLARSTVILDPNAITVQVPYGRFGMRWDEIEEVLTNGSLFSFRGGDKQLSVSMVLAGKGKREFYPWLSEEADRRNFPIIQTERVPVQHRNTRL